MTYDVNTNACYMPPTFKVAELLKKFSATGNCTEVNISLMVIKWDLLPQTAYFYFNFLSLEKWIKIRRPLLCTYI
jgi:hypothetical protein